MIVLYFGLSAFLLRVLFADFLSLGGWYVFFPGLSPIITGDEMIFIFLVPVSLRVIVSTFTGFILERGGNVGMRGRYGDEGGK